MAPALLFPSMAPIRNRRTRGATLLEMLIATTIMASLLGIGLPRLARLRSPYAAWGGARQIEATLQAVRMRAIARNARYRVNFNQSASTYTVEREVAGNFIAESAPQRLPAGARLGTITPTTTPVIDTRGMLAAQVTVPVMITGAATRTVTVNVLGKTTVN